VQQPVVTDNLTGNQRAAGADAVGYVVSNQLPEVIRDPLDRLMVHGGSRPGGHYLPGYGSLCHFVNPNDVMR
jgi:hypothetical protein